MKEGISDTYIQDGYLVIVTLKGNHYCIKVLQLEKALDKKP